MKLGDLIGDTDMEALHRDTEEAVGLPGGVFCNVGVLVVARGGIEPPTRGFSSASPSQFEE